MEVFRIYMGSELRSIIGALANSWIPKVVGVLFGLFLLGTIGIGLTQNVYSWIEAYPPDFIDSIDVWKLGMVVGTSGTATVVMVTLYVADRNYRRSREHIPNLSMELNVHRVEASRSYDAIVVTLDAKNTGTGLCVVEEVQWTIKVLSPYDNDLVEDMQAEFDNRLKDDQIYEFPWHQLKNDSTKSDTWIEPNETEQFTYEFTMLPAPTAIIVSAWVPNASTPQVGRGWYRRKLHSIEEVEPA